MCAMSMIASTRKENGSMFPFDHLPTSRRTQMEDLPARSQAPLVPQLSGKPHRKSQRKSSKIQRKSNLPLKSHNATSQPRDRQGRFAPKPSVFTPIFDKVERAQRTVKKVRHLIRRAHKTEQPIRRIRRVRQPKQQAIPQPAYRKSVKEQLVGHLHRWLRRT